MKAQIAGSPAFNIFIAEALEARRRRLGSSATTVTFLHRVLPPESPSHTNIRISVKMICSGRRSAVKSDTRVSCIYQAKRVTVASLELGKEQVESCVFLVESLSTESVTESDPGSFGGVRPAPSGAAQRQARPSLGKSQEQLPPRGSSITLAGATAPPSPKGYG